MGASHAPGSAAFTEHNSAAADFEPGAGSARQRKPHRHRDLDIRRRHIGGGKRGGPPAARLVRGVGGRAVGRRFREKGVGGGGGGVGVGGGRGGGGGGGGAAARLRRPAAAPERGTAIRPWAAAVARAGPRCRFCEA